MQVQVRIQLRGLDPPNVASVQIADWLTEHCQATEDRRHVQVIRHLDFLTGNTCFGVIPGFIGAANAAEDGENAQI